MEPLGIYRHNSLDLTGRTRLLRALLMVSLGLSALIGADNFATLCMGSVFDPENPQVTAAIVVYGLLEIALGLLGLGVLIATCVVYCMWVHRAVRGATELGAATTVTPAWAVWCHFVPFVHLFKPFQVMRELDSASRPEHTGGHDWRRFPPDSTINAWWTCWLVSGFAGQVSLRAGLFGSENSESIMLISSLISELMSVGAALALMHIVSRIARNQTDRWELQASQTTAPAMAA